MFTHLQNSLIGEHAEAGKKAKTYIKLERMRNEALQYN